MDRMAKLVSGRLRAQVPIGPHPSPELLAAFAENALPDGERGELLHHLGDCSDCREILYLALPDSPEAQKVLVLQPRPFRRWAWVWGALVASLAIVAVFFTTNRLGPKNQAASLVANAPAGSTETQIAAEKTPLELDQMRAGRDVSKTKLATTLTASANRPHPEAKHMTAKIQPGLVFDQSGEVHVQAPSTSANAIGGLGRKDKDAEKGERQKNPEVAATNGAALQSGSAGKLADYAYITNAPSKARADQQAAASQSVALSADSVSELKSLPVEGRNVQSPAPLARESTPKGTLGGIIVDPSGAVVGNAKVTMVGPIGEKIATSDPAGKFSFDLLPAGSYSLKAEANGFKATEIKQVAVLDNKTSDLQVRLELGSTSEVVEVSAAAVETTEASGAAHGLNSSTGFVAQRQQTAAQLSVQKAANSRQRGVGVVSGASVSTLEWTLSPEGAVQRSGDQGKTWQVVAVATGATFRALSAVGANIWAGGRAGALYHSADFGQTWTKVVPAGSKKLDQDIVHLDFSDALSGTVNTANGEVWTTSDGGQTWQRK